MVKMKEYNYVTGSILIDNENESDFFNQYLKDNMLIKCYDVMMKNINFNKEVIIDYILFTFPGNREYEYSEFWLLNIDSNNNKYFPVYISNINTSSYHALSCCSLDHNCDDNNLMNINNIKNLMVDIIKKDVNGNEFYYDSDENIN